MKVKNYLNYRGSNFIGGKNSLLIILQIFQIYYYIQILTLFICKPFVSSFNVACEKLQFGNNEKNVKIAKLRFSAITADYVKRFKTIF